MEESQLTNARELLAQSMINIGDYFSLNIYGLIIILIFLVIAYCVWHAHATDDHFDWTDTIKSVDQVTGREKVSATKVLQMLGGITATFVVIKLTIQAALTTEIFVIYLIYVAAVDGFADFILARYGVQNKNNITEEKKDA